MRLALLLGAGMGLAAGWAGILGENTPSTDTLRPPAAASAVEAPPDRKYLLERVDDAAVVQLYADGFEKLPLEEKQLIFHLYEAAIAGRDIYYDQRYVHNLAMRDVIEEILTHAAGVEPASLAEIQRYAKLFWVNTGPYNNLTARKFVMKLSPSALAAAIKAAQKAGARFPTKSGETLDAMIARMSPLFLDASVDPMRDEQDPRPGKGHTRGERQQPLLRRHDEGPGGLRREVPAEFAPGQTRRQARRRGVPDRRPLRRADPADRPAPRGGHPLCDRRRWPRALRALIKWYQTGETADRVAYDIAWVQDKNSPVDTINGFVEVYMDPRGHKGSWEALVFYVDPRQDRRDPQARCGCAMVRGSDAVGPSVSETGGAGHHRQRHRRRDRNGRFRTDHARRNQPAERSGDP